MELMAPILLEEIEQRPDLSPAALTPMLGVITCGLREDLERFVKVALDRFACLSDPDAGAVYVGAIFNVDAPQPRTP